MQLFLFSHLLSRIFFSYRLFFLFLAKPNDGNASKHEREGKHMYNVYRRCVCSFNIGL